MVVLLMVAAATSKPRQLIAPGVAGRLVLNDENMEVLARLADDKQFAVLAGVCSSYF